MTSYAIADMPVMLAGRVIEHSIRERGAMTEDASVPDLASSAEIDTTVSHSDRIWDYWLGGKENYPVDRALGDQIEETLPDIVTQARADRAFLGRAVRFLAG